MTELGKIHGRVAVGHPIDVATGEFFAVEIDHHVNGVVAMEVGRRFSTSFLDNGPLESLGTARHAYLPFGPGWRPSWLAELRTTLQGFVYTRCDGTALQLPDPGGRFATTGRLIS